MMRRTSLLVALTFGLSVSVFSWGAQEAPSMRTGDAAPPALIQKLIEERGYRIERVIPSEVSGVSHYVLRKGVRRFVVSGYGKYVIRGMALDGGGKDVFSQEIEGLSKPVDVSAYAALIKKYRVIWVGGIRPEIIVIGDPFDPGTAALVSQADRMVERHGARIGFLLVPGASKYSFGVVAKIHKSADPWKALKEFSEKYQGREDKFLADVKTIPKATPADARYFDSVRRLVMEQMGIDAVPVTLYRHSLTGKWGVVFGDHPLEYILTMTAGKEFRGGRVGS